MSGELLLLLAIAVFLAWLIRPAVAPGIRQTWRRPTTMS